MKRYAVGVVLLGAMMMSGCAAQRQASSLNRVQADLQMLDQRVSQLERGSVAQASSAAWPTEPSASTTASDIARGSTAPAIALASTVKPATKVVQQALKNAGVYQGAMDGKLGPQTRAAIRDFQRANGLSVDGKVGKQTWSKLSAYASASSGGTELSAAEPIK